MKKQGRAKSIARWTAWVLVLLLPAMWVVTMWWGATIWKPAITDQRYFFCAVARGCIIFGHAPSTQGADALSLFDAPRVIDVDGHATLRPIWWHEPGLIVALYIPLWMPWLVVLGFSIRFYRDHQREKQQRLLGYCPGCGYSRTGLSPNAPCPECGTLPNAEGTG